MPPMSPSDRGLGEALSRYAAVPAAEAQDKPRRSWCGETRNGKFQQTVAIGPHHLLADEPRRGRRRRQRARPL